MAPDTKGNNRIGGIDALRGLVVVLMALDHAREFIAPSAFSPTDATVTPGFLYVTRWITHLCAPTFVLLAGISCFLIRARLPGDYRNFLITRGLILVAIECTLVSLGWDFEYREINLQVIWALGISMACLGLMYRLPRQAMLYLGIALCVASYEISSRVELTNPLLVILFGAGEIAKIGTTSVSVTYAIAPWLGLMMVGYGCGEWITTRLQRGSPATGIGVGLGLLAATLLIRAAATFGDPHSWQVIPGEPVRTVMMFLDLNKYPPSPLFLGCMVGIALLLLFTIDRFPKALTDVLKVYGRAPLLFYVAHLYVIQIIRWAKVIWVHYRLPAFDELPPDVLTLSDMRGLYWTYAICGFALLVLYKPCRWFYEAKKARKMKILSYL